MHRRSFLAACGLGLGFGFVARAATDPPVTSFAEIEADIGGRVGVFALDTADGRSLHHRPDERFAMCSTFKWLLAAFVLSKMDTGDVALDERLSFTADDLLDYAPVAREHAGRGWISVETACEAAVTLSDNTAANLLLDRTGGPAALTAFIRQSGDEVTRLDRNEPSLNTNIRGDIRDTTTPRAMVGSLRTILLGDVPPRVGAPTNADEPPRAPDLLSAPSRDMLIGWLKETTTGLARLRAGLPADWSAGDKTGTGVNGAANDVAIAWPPGDKPILIASYLSESAAPADALNKAHARIAALVARSLHAVVE